jgi:RNA polymerase sigma-70 factor (ECF subfamily)
MFAEVYEPLQRYARRRLPLEAVDDLVAEALTVLWRRLDDIPDDAELPWAYAVARRCIANRRRSTDRHGRLLGRLAAARSTESVDADAAPAGDSPVARAIAALGAADAGLLRLWAWEQLEPREIAVVLGITANAASIRLHRAKSRLKEQLRKDGGGAGQELSEDDEEHHGR